MANVPPCAKCSFNKRPCPANCRYVQYFPHGAEDDYQAINMVFGSRNFLRIMDLAGSANKLASQSLIRQAKARVADPVYGLGGTAQQLREEVNDLRAELTLRGYPSGGDIDPEEPLEEQPVQNSCEACTHQKKGCPPTCALRGIFTPQRSNDLVHVLDFYGVAQFKANMAKAPPAQVRLVAESMIVEARAWSDFPDRGIEGLISTLHRQVQKLTKKLKFVKTPLKKRYM
ncbi:hypothetical protein MKX03_018024 [Papaver bracteatum]|nr:hypothetical protein MKX03_018024 [Papaver bracteatum]